MKAAFLGTVLIAAGALSGPRLLLRHGERWLCSSAAPGWLARLTIGISKGRDSCLEFETLLHDFGVALEGRAVAHAFAFRNAGDRPVRIDRLRKDCGCNRVSFPAGPIPPGQGGVVVVELDTRRRGGEQTKKVTIVTDEIQQGEIVLVLKGRIRQVLDVRRRPAPRNDLEPGETVREEYEIRPRRICKGVRLGRLEGNFFQAALQDAGDFLLLSIDKTAPQAPGAIRGELELHAVCGDEIIPHEILVQLNVEPPLRPSAQRLKLKPRPDGSYAGTLFIAVRSKKTRIVDVLATHPETKVHWKVDGLNVRIEVTASTRPPDQVLEVLHSQEPQGGDVERWSIPIHAE